MPSLSADRRLFASPRSARASRRAGKAECLPSKGPPCLRASESTKGRPVFALARPDGRVGSYFATAGLRVRCRSPLRLGASAVFYGAGS